MFVRNYLLAVIYFCCLQPIELTPAEIEANEADIRAVFAKVGQDPTEFIASLPKSYTPATPTLFS